MNFSIRYKISLLTISLVVITSVSIAIVYFNKVNTVLTENTMQQLGREISHESKRLTTKTNNVKKDTIYLARMPSVAAYIKKPGIPEKQNIQLSFANLMEVEPDYLQIRYIDKNGQEKIRVERDNNKIIVLTDDKLQDKSNSSYFQDLMETAHDKIYFSAINLNRENNKISLPHTPVIRAGTPLFNADGQLAGAIIINLDFGAELSRLKNDYSTMGETIYITDNQGGYLLHPESHKAFGTDLGHRYRVQEDFPHAAALFLNDRNLQQQTLLPHEHIKDAIMFVKLQLDNSNPERYITIGISKDYQAILISQYRLLAESSFYVIVLIIFSTLLTLWFSGRLTKPLQIIAQAINKFSQGQTNISLPVNRSDELGVLARNFDAMFNSVKKAQHDLEHMNDSLEQQVKQRTSELSRFKTTLDKTLDCVFMFNPVDFNFFYVNDGAIKQVGYSYDELLSMKAYDIKPLYSKQQFIELVAPMIAGDVQTVNFETQHQHKDGSIIPVEVFLQYINPENEQPRFVAIVRDITERKKIDRMKNEFISTVSHELRTPLTSIRGSLGLLVGGAAGDLEPQGKSLLQIAHKNTERLLLLINDILDISKIESGKMEFNYKEIDLRHFLQQAIEANTDYGTQYHVDFKIADCPDNATIFADEDRMLQVMNNLMSNAAKFSPEHSTVFLSAERINNSLRISVKDHGKGIPEEFRKTIFDRFVQADSSDTRQAGGTGLGLNITQAIIKKHNGQIDFHNEPGKGTTFYFDLPSSQKSSQQLNTQSAYKQLTSKQILICEDDPDIAQLLRMVFAQNGYASDIAYSAQQTRELLAHNKYHALTLDIMLPEESGITLFEEIRANPATQNLPIIVISAIADEAKKQLNGGAIGVVDWITKPIDQQRLIASMDTLFHNKTKGMPRILHIEDEDDVLTYIKVLFENKADIIAAKSVSEAKQALVNNTYNLVILDVGLPDGTGFDLLPYINKLNPAPPVVVFSAQDISTDIAHQFNNILIKSRASNEQLFNTVASYLKTEKEIL